jgi:hypothetical protein
MPQTSLLCIIPFVKFLKMSVSVQCLNMCVTSVRHCKEAFISRNVAKGMTQRRLDCGIDTICPQLQLISFLQINRLYPFHVASGLTYCSDKVLDSFHELSECLALTLEQCELGNKIRAKDPLVACRSLKLFQSAA